MAGVAARLLESAAGFDITLLETVVNAFYSATSPEEREVAERELQQLQDHPDTWTRVDAILEQTQNINTKFFALRVLEAVIRYRWAALAPEQREGVRNYLSNLTIKMAADENIFRRDRSLVSKVNVLLVQVVKHEWPARWPSFISDLTGAAKISEVMCENCMHILKLLSEEVFDFSRGEMTQEKTRHLKSSLNDEFGLIHELGEYVLTHSQKPLLIQNTLTTLHAYLSWVPVGYIFESTLVETLLKLFPTLEFRNVALQCLTEVGMLPVATVYDKHLVHMYTVFITQLQMVLPRGTNIPEAYANGSSDDQCFFQNLAMFLTGFFKMHIGLLDKAQENHQTMLIGLEYLLGISYVEDTEVFKVCLDYWNHLVCDLFQSECTVEPQPFGFHNMGGDPQGPSARKQLYHMPMTRLRLLVISRMAKPEEVIVVEDENGNIVRETLKDSDVLAQYKQMRETLVYLSHLDHSDTQNQMLEKLALQLSGKEYAWNTLNSLCWAIGSISGSMTEDLENKFLVTVIRDLLNLCEFTRGKDHKAIIASNIMYVVGQYPRFLRAHWKFLKTVVNKLFEFMHEVHPGVQDMACDTFLKIARKCKRKFVIQQMHESEPFVCELLQSLTDTIKDLEPHHIHLFYDAVGEMISAETDPMWRDQYLKKLMEPPNANWYQIIEVARTNAETLKQPEVIRSIANILQTNTSVCGAVGQPFQSQISLIFEDMLHMYKLYSEFVSSAVMEGGKFSARTTQVKLMRSVKCECLRLIEVFVMKTEDPDLVCSQMVPAMMDPILGDYVRNVADARDPEVLSLFAAIFNKVQGKLSDEVPRVFDAVFQCTLQMITRNFEDYPEHRPKFFELLRAITNHCFRAMLSLTPQNLKLVIDSVVWAFRHTERNVAEMGLNLLLEMLHAFQQSEFCNQFYKSYYIMLMQEVFAVLTDIFHKPGFKSQALILQHLYNLVLSPSLTVPLWDADTLGPTAFPNNAEFVRQHTVQLLSHSFPNMHQQQIVMFVEGLFETRSDFSSFKGKLRDFLVQSKEWTAGTEQITWEEQQIKQEQRSAAVMAIPGMKNPYDLPDEMADE
eukprot:CAMPEP_0114249878 /NCGR_PEP_ID=MMETSP0058-20121206/14395_1 /TAXON_ID=36894 /ORGANISM="Pyramimonas parkeae, CCMP726" /LENGTH=1067 /DNA_ID=CAMNT_0001363489 /DNA_START=188 /DNA_END=3391 /DNA_ORIENTATION=+